MSAGTLNLFIDQGATFRQSLLVQNDDGTAVNLTGYSARMQARVAAAAQGQPVLEMSTADGRLIITPQPGRVDLVLTPEETEALPPVRLVYDLELIEPGGGVVRLVQGDVAISREVTR